MAKMLNYVFCISIFALLAGGVGGSFQPSRMLIIAVTPYVLAKRIDLSGQNSIVSVALGCLGAMFLLGMISLTWSTDRVHGVGLLVTVAIGMSAVLLSTAMDRSQLALTRVVWAWAWVLIATLPIAFYEIVSGNHFMFAFDERVIGNLGSFPFASVFFGNYNDYSTFMCLSFPFLLSALMLTNKRSVKAFLSISVIACLAVVVIDTSRGAMFVMSMMMLLYMYKVPKIRPFFLIGAVIVLPILLVVLARDINNLSDLVMFRFNSTDFADESYIQRAGIISAGWDAIQSTYGFGVGIGGFEVFMSTRYPYFIPNPHNIFLEIAVNFGIISAILFAIIIIKLFFTALANREMPDSLKFPIIFNIPFVPIIGVISSQAIGYTYWWVWLASVVAIAAGKSSDTGLRSGVRP